MTDYDRQIKALYEKTYGKKVLSVWTGGSGNSVVEFEDGTKITHTRSE